MEPCGRHYLTTPKEFQDYTCSIIQAFRKGNQHQFIDVNLSRTRFIIDSESKWIKSQLDWLAERDQRYKIEAIFRPQTIGNPMLVELFINGRGLGFIYAGMAPLDHEQKRIKVLRDLPADFPDEKLAALQKEHYYGESYRRFWVSEVKSGDKSTSIADLILTTATHLIDALNKGKIVVGNQEQEFKRENVFEIALRQAYEILGGQPNEAFKNDLQAVAQNEWNQKYASQAQEFYNELFPNEVLPIKSKESLTSNMEVWLLASDIIITVRSSSPDAAKIQVEAAMRDVGSDKEFEYKVISGKKTPEAIKNDGIVNTTKLFLDEKFLVEQSLNDHFTITPFKEVSVKINEAGVEKEFRFPFLWTGEVT